MSINIQPGELRDEIATAILSVRPQDEEVPRIREQLLNQKYEATSELIVECFYRCLVTDDLQRRYGIGLDDLPSCVNSSHVPPRRVCGVGSPHTHGTISLLLWKWAWKQMQKQHPEVDNGSPVQRGSEALRHADLYVVAQEQVVSVEFKYVGVAGVRNAKAVAAQMQRYVEKHAATLLVIYSGTEAGSEVQGMARLRKWLDPAVPVVLLHGDAIAPAKKPR
jgi:hypothetical protein